MKVLIKPGNESSNVPNRFIMTVYLLIQRGTCFEVGPL